MGNWSCLYHWFECKDTNHAEQVFDRLSQAIEAYDWSDPAKTGLKFGFVSDRLIQAVTCQKWGLETDFSHHIQSVNSQGAAICAGVDNVSYFHCLGDPVTFVLSWDYFFATDPKLNLQALLNTSDVKNFEISQKFNRPALCIPVPHTFNRPFFDESDIHDDPSYHEMEELFKPLLSRHEPTDIVFGRNDPIHGDVNFGVLRVFGDGEFYYDTSGAYNILKREVLAGGYLTPILDEPVLEL